jgi:hypothetical protein
VAFMVLAAKAELRHLSIGQRNTALRGGFNDRDPKARQACVDLLVSWFRGANPLPTASRADTRLIRHLDSSAHGLVRRWFAYPKLPPARRAPPIESCRKPVSPTHRRRNVRGGARKWSLKEELRPHFRAVSCTCEYGLRACREKSAGVAGRRRCELICHLIVSFAAPEGQQPGLPLGSV